MWLPHPADAIQGEHFSMGCLLFRLRWWTSCLSGGRGNMSLNCHQRASASSSSSSHSALISASNLLAAKNACSWPLRTFCTLLGTCKVSPSFARVKLIPLYFQLKKILKNTSWVYHSSSTRYNFRAPVFGAFYPLPIQFLPYQVNMITISRYTTSAYSLMLDLPVVGIRCRNGRLCSIHLLFLH